MTQNEITELFYKAIQEKAVYNKIENISRNQVYNWNEKRTIPSLGNMLEVLFQLKLINVSLNECISK
jgi:ribosomal protein S8